ncbi:MAG: TIGR03560 family F420-dependent LLM class oxidoreductase [Ilumatobacteraceae bacterium]
MRFSLWPTTKQTWADVLDVTVHAERTGWDGVWVSDHFMGVEPTVDVPVLECWTVVTALAAAVPRLRLGTLVLGNGYRHPAVVAKMAATLDHVSAGRFVLGLGAGWQANEHAAFGLPFPPPGERLARLDEACAVIRSLITQERTTLPGRYYQLHDAPLSPKPVQQCLPLLVGGSGERVTIPLAARWADEWNYWGTPAEFGHRSRILDRACAAVGRDPSTIRRSVQAVVIPHGAGVRADDLPGAKASIRGTAEQLRDVLGSYADAGADEFILPDWNAGRGTARADFIDWFRRDVAQQQLEPTPFPGVTARWTPAASSQQLTSAARGTGHASCRTNRR